VILKRTIFIFLLKLTPMKPIFKSLRDVLFLLIIFSVRIVNAQEIDENNLWNTYFISSIGQTGTNFYAQSFYANVNVITKFGVVIQQIDAEGQVILSIAADNGSGAPNVSAPLYQGMLKDPTTTGAWYYETGINIPVIPGQKYWILIDGYNNAGATGRSAIGRSANYTDTGESFIYSNAAGIGSWNSIPGDPLAIYVEGIKPATIDENNGWNTNWVSSIGASGSSFYAQSFDANVDIITRFGAVIMEIAAEGQLILSIAGDNGYGAPNVSAPLYQGALINPTTTGLWYFEKGLNIPVTIGQKYWILIDGYTNVGATGRSAVGISSSFTDTGEGMLYTNSDGLGSWNSIPSMPLAINVEGIRKAIVDENNGYNGNVVSSLGETGSNFYAQSFYANVDTITNFGAFLREIDPEGELTLAIAANNGSGYPNIVAPLYQGSLLNPPAAGAWFFEKGIRVPVTVGTKYWVVIDGYQNPGASGKSCVGLSASYTDTGEGMLYSNAGGIGVWSSIPTMPLSIFVDGTLTSLTVSDTIIDNQESSCFDATGTITVAGTSSVECLSGSSVDFIAGRSIDFLPGFHAKSGSYVHAYITSDGEFCSLALSSPAYNESYKSTVISTTETQAENPVCTKVPGLKIYPNPTDGIFTVEMNNLNNSGTITISNLLGEVMIKTSYKNSGMTMLNISRLKQGFYLIQVNDGKSSITQKILKN
jgi:hypothetical protein